jgi:WD40 repeat protein
MSSAAPILLTLLLGQGQLPIADVKPNEVTWPGAGLKPAEARLRLGTGGLRIRGYSAGATMSPDGRLLAIADSPKNWTVRDRVTGKIVVETKSTPGLFGNDDDGGNLVLQFAPDGKSIAVGTHRMFSVYETVAGKKIATIGKAGGSDDPKAQEFSFERLSFSADGSRLALSTTRGTFGQGTIEALCWDIATGKLVKSIRALADGHVDAVLSPDGKTMATFGGSGPRVDPEQVLRVVQLWNVDSGKELGKIDITDSKKLDLQRPSVVDVAFAPDGKTIAVWAKSSEGFGAFGRPRETGAILLYDTATRTDKRLLKAPAFDRSARLAFSPDGKRLVARADKAVEAWQVATGTPIALKNPAAGPIRAVAFPKADEIEVLAQLGETLAWWDAVSGRPGFVPHGHLRGVQSLAFTRDGKSLLSLSADGLVVTWDPANGSLRKATPFAGDPTQNFRLSNRPELSAWGTNLVLDGRGVTAFEVATGNRLFQANVENKVGRVTFGQFALSFSPQEDKVVIAAGKQIRTFDVSGDEAAKVDREDKADREGIEILLSPDGKQVAVLLLPLESQGGFIPGLPAAPTVQPVLFDAATGKVLQLLPKSTDSWIAAYSVDGRALAVGDKGSVKIHSTASGALEKTLALKNEKGTPMVLRYSPGGKYLAVSSYEGRKRPADARGWLELFDVASGKSLHLWRGHDGPIAALAFSPDGKMLASGGFDSTVLVWPTDVADAIVELPKVAARPAPKRPFGVPSQAFVNLVEKMHGELVPVRPAPKDREDRDGPPDRNPEPPTSYLVRFAGPVDVDAFAKLRAGIGTANARIGLALFKQNGIKDADLAGLKDFDGLVGLYLQEIDVSDAGLTNLGALKNVETFVCTSPAITDAGLAAVGKMTKLRSLKIESQKITAAGFAHLVKLADIEELQVNPYKLRIGDEVLRHLKGMTKLRALEIGYYGDRILTDAGMADLGNLVGMTRLEIRDGGGVTVKGIAALGKLKSMKQLTLHQVKAASDAALAFVAPMADLESLRISSSGRVPSHSARSLVNLKKLKYLSLDDVDDEALAGSANLTSLDYLSLQQSKIGDQGMRHLAKLTGLKFLALPEKSITSAGIKQLAGCRSLETLFASRGDIDDSAFEALGKLTKMGDLRLTDCKITGTGLKHLVDLKELHYLSLSGNPLTDAAIKSLKKMTNVRDVILTATNISDEAAEQLKKALPRARILDADGMAVGKESAGYPKMCTEDLAGKEARFVVTGIELAAEIKKGRDEARKKYDGKIIEVTGKINSLAPHPSGEGTIVLADGQRFSFGALQCVVSDPQPWAKYAPGQEITIRGRWPSGSSGMLTSCIIVKAGPSPAISISARDLAKEFSTNAEAARVKYDKKPLLVSGEVTAKEVNSGGAATIKIKGDGQVALRCFLGGSFGAEGQLRRGIRPGQPIRMLAEFSAFYDGHVSLDKCLPIKAK